MPPKPTKDILGDIRIKFQDVQKLSNDEGKFRSEEEPHKIKYQLIYKLKWLEKSLTKILAHTPKEEQETKILMLAVVHLNLGELYIDINALRTGKEELMKCIKLLKNKELEPAAILILLSALNPLGHLWYQWNKPTKAQDFLLRAEQIYNDFINAHGDSVDPISMAQTFGIEESEKESHPREMLEGLHIFTLNYLTLVYESMEDFANAAKYCLMTLSKELSRNESMQDLDYTEWALNATVLSHYFTKNDNFTQARHLLAAAAYILEKYEDILKRKTENDGDNEALEDDWENFQRKSAYHARCWALYGIMLLSSSKSRLMKENESEKENEQSDDNSSEPKILDTIRFDILEEKIKPIENQITDKYLLNFDDAKLVFLNMQKWLNQAKLYYTLEDHASDYIIIVQDISQGYKYLSFFETDKDRQAKMHKRRINILEDVIEKVNPYYYKAACRKIWIELGETYYDILGLKADRENPMPQTVAKIDKLARSSIKNFEAFLDSLEVDNSGTEIKQFPHELVQTALLSYLHLGRLYGKLVSSDKTNELENTEKRLNAFKFVVDYCKKYPETIGAMNILNPCKQAIDLLSLEIKSLQNKIINK
ncbi:KIF-binding protein [Anthophora plagiata]